MQPVRVVVSKPTKGLLLMVHVLAFSMFHKRHLFGGSLRTYNTILLKVIFLQKCREKKLVLFCPQRLHSMLNCVICDFLDFTERLKKYL